MRRERRTERHSHSCDENSCRPGERERGGRSKIRVPPMLDMPKLLEKGAHTWDRWEVFTLKPEYQMAS